MVNLQSEIQKEKLLLNNVQSTLLSSLDDMPEFPATPINKHSFLMSVNDIGNNWSAEHHSKLANINAIKNVILKATSISQLHDRIMKIIKLRKIAHHKLHPFTLSLLEKWCTHER